MSKRALLYQEEASYMTATGRPVQYGSRTLSSVKGTDATPSVRPSVRPRARDRVVLVLDDTSRGRRRAPHGSRTGLTTSAPTERRPYVRRLQLGGEGGEGGRKEEGGSEGAESGRLSPAYGYRASDVAAAAAAVSHTVRLLK